MELRNPADAKPRRKSSKPSRDPSTVPARYLQPPKRVFGAVRSSNPTVDGPSSLKPHAAVVNPPNRKPSLPHRPDPKKALPVMKKSPLTVSSSAPATSAERRSGITRVDPEPCSPLPVSSKTPVLETPYHSARNCSGCKIDRLESASYWITQIRLAESVGKHSIAASFFRLASECRAEPSRKLWMELRTYVERHGLTSDTWSDVRRLYGLPGKKVDACSGGTIDGGPECEDHCIKSPDLPREEDQSDCKHGGETSPSSAEFPPASTSA